MIDHSCPICGGTKFVDYNGRIGIRCANCKTLERARLLWATIQKLDLMKKGKKVLHVAPENFLAKFLYENCGETYQACDFNPDVYKNEYFPVKKIDLRYDLNDFPDGSVDLVIMNHVLEHIGCDLDPILVNIKRIISPGGSFLFSVPVRGDYSTEDLSSDLSDEQRTERFGQHDHYRIFGSKDFPEKLKSIFGYDVVGESKKLFTEEELVNINVPPRAIRRLTSHTILTYTKSAA